MRWMNKINTPWNKRWMVLWFKWLVSLLGAKPQNAYTYCGLLSCCTLYSLQDRLLVPHLMHCIRRPKDVLYTAKLLKFVRVKYQPSPGGSCLYQIQVYQDELLHETEFSYAYRPVYAETHWWTQYRGRDTFKRLLKTWIGKSAMKRIHTLLNANC